MMAEALRRTAEKAAGDDGLQIGDITIHRLADIDRIPWPIEAMFSNDADGLIRGAHKLLPRTHLTRTAGADRSASTRS